MHVNSYYSEHAAFIKKEGLVEIIMASIFSTTKVLGKDHLDPEDYTKSVSLANCAI